MAMQCPLCLKQNTETFETGLPSFRHLDFTNLERASVISRCKDCGILFNALEPMAATANDQVFCSKDYSQSHQTIQTIKVKEFDQPVTRSFLQAELIRQKIKKDHLTILDVGCFDGELLKELDKRFAQCELHGFDVNEYIREEFPKADRFHFWSGDMKKIEGSFDLICFSHSLMYIKDIHAVIAQVKRLLKPEGHLYIQTANISCNPFSLLLGDQYYYYTPEILKNIFAYVGIELSIGPQEWFSREIVGFGKLNASVKATRNIQDDSLDQCLGYLREIQQRLTELNSQGGMSILGTTANAAFVDSILNGKNSFFVDENPKRIGTRFRSKDVRAIDALGSIHTLIIPYRENSKNISTRLSEKYKAQFICV